MGVRDAIEEDVQPRYPRNSWSKVEPMDENEVQRNHEFVHEEPEIVGKNFFMIFLKAIFV